MIILFRSTYDFKEVLKRFPREKNKNVTLAVLTSGGDSQGKNSIVKKAVHAIPININSLTARYRNTL